MPIVVVNIVPKMSSGETNQDAEPNLAVDPSNTQHLAASAFTLSVAGHPGRAPIYVSDDGGNSWRLNHIVPAATPPGPDKGGQATQDITVRFSPKGGRLYASILRVPRIVATQPRLNILRSTDFLAVDVLMTVLVDRNDVDQPYVQVGTPATGADSAKDRVFVGSNDFGQAGGQTATVDVSQDGAAAAPPSPSGFKRDQIEARAPFGQDAPAIRPAVHSDGTVYAAFYHWTAQPSANIITTDVIVVRDDNWASGATPFSALTDPSDGVRGRKVVTGRALPFNVTAAGLGQERLAGSDLSIAVDPTNSSNVWIAWADRIGANDYTLHVRRSTDKGVTWSADLKTVTNGKNPALAVNSDGQVGFMYQQLTGAGATQRWVTHIERTSDAFAHVDDKILATTPAAQPVSPPGQFPYLGDYAHMLAVGRDFYGIFCANNTPDHANFPQGVTFQRNADFTTKQLLNLDGTTPVAISIDPFFFKVTG